MKKVAGKKMRGPTLQEFELVPITDPAELEAVDRRCKAAKEAMAAAERNGGIGSLLMNLSPKAVRCVIAALDNYQKCEDGQRQKDGLLEDDVSDLVNDRRNVEAIKKELQEYHDALLRKRGAVQTERCNDGTNGEMPFSVPQEGA